MSVEQARSAGTVARYEIEATKFVNMFCREHHADVCDAPYESRLSMTILWFLGCHGVWSKAYIRLVAAALGQRLEMFVLSGLINDNPDPEKSLLTRLKRARPESIEKREKADKAAKKIAHQKKIAVKEIKKRRKPRKSLRVQELRAVIQYFRGKTDRFSLWIAGYLIVASRLGWRPGEMVALRREGNYLRAQAEKHTNGRGLGDACEVDISAYPKWLVDRLDQWISDISVWEAEYGGLWNLRTVMNGRLATACKSLDMARISTYTLRHFAISCMKASGFSKSEIAVIVNHASNRTATERYGKGRGGIKRAKKMLRFNEERLLLVRDKARGFVKKAEDAPDEDSPAGDSLAGPN